MQSYKTIAAEIGGADGAQTLDVDAAKSLLASLREERLLLVDGVDDIDAMSGLWLPGHHGNILYTS